MGVDWYTFTNFSAVGFSVDGGYGRCESVANKLGDKYAVLFYSEVSGEEIDARCYIYDKSTECFDQISVPGPYEINKYQHQTSVQECPNTGRFFAKPIEDMDANVGSGVLCSFKIISTSMGVGEIKRLLLDESRTFSNSEEYLEFYGYKSESDDDDDNT